MRTKIFIFLLALMTILIVSCTGFENGNEFTKEDAISIEDDFIARLFPQKTDDGLVEKFETKDDLVKSVSKKSEDYLAKSFVDTYYEESEDGLYIRPMDGPVRILKDEPMKLDKIDKDQYELVQEGNDDLRGRYTFTVRFIKRDKEWIIKERIFEPKNIESSNDDNIMDEFRTLLIDKPDISKVISYIDENIKSISEKNASIMIYDLEDLQIGYLENLNDKVNTNNVLQEKLRNMGLEIIDDIDNIDDEELKNALVQLRKDGYKLSEAEGMYFPIIDYELYEKYKEYVMLDTSEYIDIMQKESNKQLAKDASLMISWEELVKRAIEQEGFIENYKDSNRIEEVKEKYKNYVRLIFFGLDNTPLFSYEDNTMVKEARDDYTKIVDIKEDSALIENLKDFLEVTKQSDYRLTKEVEKYREDIVKKIVSKY